MGVHPIAAPLHDRQDRHDRPLTWRDRLALVNMVLFICVGGLLLVRSFTQGASLWAYLMGGLFLLAGGYRFFLVFSILKRRLSRR